LLCIQNNLDFWATWYSTSSLLFGLGIGWYPLNWRNNKSIIMKTSYLMIIGRFLQSLRETFRRKNIISLLTNWAPPLYQGFVISLYFLGIWMLLLVPIIKDWPFILYIDPVLLDGFLNWNKLEGGWSKLEKFFMCYIPESILRL